MTLIISEIPVRSQNVTHNVKTSEMLRKMSRHRDNLDNKQTNVNNKSRK